MRIQPYNTSNMSFKNNSAKRVAKYIASNKRAQNVLKYASTNTSLFNSMFVFGIAMILKPVSIFYTPTPEDDKRYGIARSLSTGIADLGIAALVFIPLNKAIRKAGDKLYKSKGTIYHDNAKKISQYKSLFNRGFKIALLPLLAFSKFFFIKPIINIATKKEKPYENK